MRIRAYLITACDKINSVSCERGRIKTDRAAGISFVRVSCNIYSVCALRGCMESLYRVMRRAGVGCACRLINQFLPRLLRDFERYRQVLFGTRTFDSKCGTGILRNPRIFYCREHTCVSIGVVRL